VGVIGTGRIGRMHAELLTASVPGAALAAVSDAVMPLAAEVGTALGVPVLETRHLLDNDAIDAVAICSSTDTHVPLLVAAAEAGKAVFCEKPISLDLAEVDRALSEAERTATPLMVGFNRRFDASHAAVRHAVASGALGPPHLARITSRDPGPPPLSYARTSGGIFLDMTIHDFDMARFVVGSEVVEVYAAGAVRVVPELAELGDVDTAVVTLWHENECLTVIDNSRQASYGYDQRVEVLGADALAASENPLVNTALTRDGNGTRLAPLPNFFIERYTASYIRQWEAFVAAIAAGEAPPTTGHDGRAALVLGLAAKLSLLERRPVRVAEVG
jgi:myo-inositol 2-dehydrogenase/D-chiro-inositol 1-dehydrogenase